MKTRIITITLLILTIAFAASAQDQSVSNMELEKGLPFHSVNLTLGYYSPEMAYWNDTYLPAKGITETFDGNVVFGANLTFLLPADLRARVGGSYWSGKVNGTAASSIDALKIGFTRFNLGLLYAPEKIAFAGFQPYLGIEGQVNLIKNTYDIDQTITNRSGHDMSFAPVLGIDRGFGKINCAFEVKYLVGNYIQEESAEQLLKHEVSMSGAEISFSIGYRF